MMSLSSPLALAAGSPPVRAAVNAACHVVARRRVAMLGRVDPVEVQRKTLLGLVRKARATRFGRDHGFASIGSVEEFRKSVPLRTYEDLWNTYLQGSYPVLDDLTWPGRIPYFALTSGTTQGATKYIPVTREMAASNKKAGFTMLAYHLAARPESKLFLGRFFFLGGSTDLERPAPGVRQGDLSGIAAEEVAALMRPYTFPPLELALESNWDRKLAMLAEGSLRERITSIGGVPSWLLMFFQRPLRPQRQVDRRRGLARPRAGRPRRDQVRPLQEGIRGSPRQPEDPDPGDVSVFGRLRRLRRPGDRPAPARLRPRDLLRVRPGRRARLRPADAALARERRGGGQLRDRRLDLRGDVGRISSATRSGSSRPGRRS